MKRRLYFLLPDAGHAQSLVNELEAQGIDRKSMHAIAGRGGELGALPAASQNQKKDLGARIEHTLWNGNLITFFVALLVLLMITLLQVNWLWLLLPVGVMLISFFAGLEFVTRIPDVHLAEFQDAMQHREILLTIDVPVRQVARVEELVHRHHPEAITGGVGWSIDALHV